MMIEEVASLVEEVDRLLEAGKRNPYKRKSTLDGGPRGGSRSKTGEWDCECANYECSCTSSKTGEVKKMKTTKGYKKKYNKEYRARPAFKRWRSRVRAGLEPPPSPKF